MRENSRRNVNEYPVSMRSGRTDLGDVPSLNSRKASRLSDGANRCAAVYLESVVAPNFPAVEPVILRS